MIYVWEAVLNRDCMSKTEQVWVHGHQLQQLDTHDFQF